MNSSVEWELRGIPLWLLQEYVQELGGGLMLDGGLLGDGWQVSLSQMEDYQIGSIRVGQVRLALEATPEAMEKIRPALEKKLLRAGG